MKLGLRKVIIFSVIPVICFFVSDIVFTSNTAQLKRADLIVVLGNPVNKDGTIGITQKSRVKAGVDLYEKGLADKILFTGGAAVNRFVESDVMKQFALNRGVPSKDVLIETRSINTIQNAFYSNQIIQGQNVDSIILVTSAYHTLRAKFVFKKYGYHIQTKAVFYPKELGFTRKATAMFYEYAAWLYYSIHGWEIAKTG